MKLITILTVIIINLIIINCKLQCNDNNNVNYNLVQGNCGGGIVNEPKLVISNFFDFDNIDLTPIGNYKKIIGTTIEIGLGYGKSYIVTVTNSACNPTNSSFTITTNNGPRFNITHAKCSGSVGFIDFIKTNPMDNTIIYSYQVNGVTIPSLPYQVSTNEITNGIPINAIVTENNGGTISTCQSGILFKYGFFDNPSVPIINIINPTCLDENGGIEIKNKQIYSTIELYLQDDPNTIIQTTNFGVYNGLKIGDYIIKVVELNGGCGVQTFTRTLKYVAPYYKVVSIDNSCPKYPLLSLQVNTTHGYSVIVNGSQTTNPFKPTYPPGSVYNFSIDITLSMVCGDYYTNYKIPNSIPDVHYTIDQNDDYCKQDYIITLINSTSFSTPFTIESTDLTKQQISNVLLDSTNSIHANINNVYTVSSYCFSDSIIIGKNYPKPIVQFSEISDYCTDHIDIYVNNWLDFEEGSLYLQVLSIDGLTYFPELNYTATNGLFKNVSNQYLQLSYRYRNCSITKYTKIGNRKELRLMDSFSIELDILDTPKCYDYFFSLYSDVKVTVTARKDKTNEIMGIFNNFLPLDDSLVTGVDIPVSVFKYYGGWCSISRNFYIKQPIAYSQPIFTVETIKKPTCKYMNDGLIKISANFDYSAVIYYYITIKIQGVSVDITSPGGLFSVGYGNNSIEIDFPFACNDILIYHFIDTNENEMFQIDYTISPVSSCNLNDGSISISNWDTYNSLVFNGSIVTGNTISGKSSWFYQLLFNKTVDNADFCIGNLDVYIPSMDATVNYIVHQNPLCNFDAGGIVQFDGILETTSNKILNIDSVYSYYDKIQYQTNLITDMLPGNHLLIVSNGTCSFKVPLDIGFENVEINYQIMTETADSNCLTHGVIEFNTDNQFAKSSLQFKTPIQYIGLQAYGPFGNLGHIQMVYGSQLNCSAHLFFNLEYSTQDALNYKVIQKSNLDCQQQDYELVDIQILNPTNYTMVTIGGISMNENGLIKNVNRYSIYSEFAFGSCSSVEYPYLIEPDYIDIDYNILNDKQITTETCHGSKNGEINISNLGNDDYYYLATDLNFIGSSTIYNNMEMDILLPLVSVNDLSLFGYITTGNVTILKINKNNPTCIQQEFYYLNSDEPTLNSIVNRQCLDDENKFGSIELVSNINDITYQFNLLSTNNNTGSITTFTNNTIVDNIKSGNYSFDSIEITTNYCIRKLNPIYVSVPNVQCLNSTSSDDDGGNNKNLGLIIGLPIGLFFLILIIISVILFKRKRHIFDKVNIFKGDDHELETIQSFQGNRIVNLDKF